MAEDRSKNNTEDICRKHRGHRHSVRANQRIGSEGAGERNQYEHYEGTNA